MHSPDKKTITEFAAKCQINPNLITKWKRAVIADLPTLFDRGTATDEKAEALEAKIGDASSEMYHVTHL